MEFTVVGDAVNRASRYCDAAQGGQVLISPDVYQRVHRDVEAKEVSVETKHAEKLRAYQVLKVKEHITVA